jgi:hypothetical protein
MSTDAYLDAKATFERIDKEVRQLGETIANVGFSISRSPGPGRFSFSNVGGKFPMDAVMGEECATSNGSSWPTAQQVNDRLGDWHDAKSAMMATWRAIPPERRSGLLPPLTEDPRQVRR